jgi:acetyltransferase-like isoleucine patch superfamily enzyme
VATHDIDAGSISGGVPAKEIKRKSDVKGDGWKRDERD